LFECNDGFSRPATETELRNEFENKDGRLLITLTSAKDVNGNNLRYGVSD